MDHRDVCVIERSENFSLALESGYSFLIARKLVGQHFDRNLALQLGVARAVHLTHASLSK